MFNSQQLLFPMLLELEPRRTRCFKRCGQTWSHWDSGFGISVAHLQHDAVPAGLKRASEPRMIQSMLEEYSEFRRANFSARDALAAGFACRARPFAPGTNSPRRTNSLMDELFATEFPLTCPHDVPQLFIFD